MASSQSPPPPPDGEPAGPRTVSDVRRAFREFYEANEALAVGLYRFPRR